MKKIFLTSIMVITLAGCSTPYQRKASSSSTRATLVGPRTNETKQVSNQDQVEPIERPRLVLSIPDTSEVQQEPEKVIKVITEVANKPLNIGDIAKHTFPSVVMIVTKDRSEQLLSLGSGFFVREDIVATNRHVMEGAVTGYAKIVGKEQKYPIAGYVAIDDRLDLILLKIENAIAPSLSLGKSAGIAVGDEVFVVGNPQGLEGTFSKGIISAIRAFKDDYLLQITAPISPGSSGGPVLNTQGEVIGVSVATFKGGQNLNFAIPSSSLQPLLTNLNPAKSLAPISGRAKINRQRSILETLGSKSTEGVVGRQLIWRYKFAQYGNYSFSLQNRLQQTVKDIWCLVLFYDDRSQPIDFDLVKCREIIPPGLAKRAYSVVDSSVKELTTREHESKPYTKVEFRILDFQIMESEDFF